MRKFNYCSTLLLLAICTVFNLYSCHDESNIPDVSDVSIDYKLIRFDQALEKIDTSSAIAELGYLQDQYPEIFNLYFKIIIPIADPNTQSINVEDPQFVNKFKEFIIFSPIRDLQDEINEKYPKSSGVFSHFDRAFKYLKYYYPEYETPNVYTVLSEYAYAVFLFEDDGKDGLGIGLDMFLGNEYPYKSYNPQSTKFSDYHTRSFNSDHLIRKAMAAIADDKAKMPNGNNFIDFLLYEGKKLYFLKQILPETHDSIIFEFSEEQMDWVSQNEFEMWSYVLDEDMLFKNNREKIVKYLKPAPTSPEMPQEAPGRALTYNGYHIISDFMKRNSDITLAQLMEMDNTNEIFKKSKYKPYKK